MAAWWDNCGEAATSALFLPLHLSISHNNIKDKDKEDKDKEDNDKEDNDKEDNNNDNNDGIIVGRAPPVSLSLHSSSNDVKSLPQ